MTVVCEKPEGNGMQKFIDAPAVTLKFTKANSCRRPEEPYRRGRLSPLNLEEVARQLQV